ncbi:hypothetical protein RHSIM_Rhsim09G0140400 [Rhododendron simsii]|uniref:DUF4283 domain-containing protein n=1 Tax=Rhododendron simsii TaxID=118357 RepID=A0A834GCJ5_RHOSS|nr:hypothetical protein RHSIM_Rhsim09G0140400 [Rhododendron simsii]
MGGRYVIITFSSEERRNEILKEKWLELWFEEVNPWNGESANNERFVWVACYGMPLNAWNVPSFKDIGSIWGCFIEVDNDTLREVSFAEGRVLIATENPSKIDGEVQLIVKGRKYNVRVEEEDTFRTVNSTYLVSNSEAQEEDDEADNTEDDRDASKKKEENSVDDMEQQRNKYRMTLKRTRKRKLKRDSQSPLIEDCSDSVNNSSQVQNTEAQEGNKQKQEKERVTEVTNNPVACDSNIIIRASQVQGINLHVDLNQSAVRRSIRSQQLEASLSTEGDDFDGYIIASQEQEQNAMDEELQNTLIAGKTLGIKFGDTELDVAGGGLRRDIMKVPKGCLYNVVMIGLLVLLHVGVFYFESKGDVPEAILGSICWLLLFILSIVNLILKPHHEDGFWNCYNATIIIVLIAINVLGIVFGLLKKIDGDWCIVVEVCAILVEDSLFLRHLYVANSE